MSVIPSIASLPPELLDTIFDYLDCTRKDDLCTCSLVSRAWNALVKPHLFHTIVLTLRQPAAWRRVYREHVPDIVDLEHGPNWKDVDGTRIPRRTLQDVHNFFSRFPIAASAVRDLKLVQFPSSFTADRHLRGADATGAHWYTENDDCPLELLLRVLSLLPRLSILRLAYFLPRLLQQGRPSIIERFIRSARGRQLPRAETFQIAKRSSLGELTTISQLYIDLERRDGQTDLSGAEARLDALLGYLDDLSELHIFNFTNFTYVLMHSELERFPHTCLREQRRLKTLTLNNCTMKPSFFDAVRESPAADTLEVFDLRPTRFLTEPDVHAISASDALVKKVGPHLKSFRYWIDPDVPVIDISTFATLQTLTLRLELHLTTRHEMLDMLEPIVTSIPTSVERLHFQVSTTARLNPHGIITTFLRILVGLDSTLAGKVKHGSLREICSEFWVDRYQDLSLDGVCALFSVPRPQFERLTALGIRV